MAADIKRFPAESRPWEWDVGCPSYPASAGPSDRLRRWGQNDLSWAADLEARDTSSTVGDPVEPPAREDSQDVDEQHGIAIDLDQLDLSARGRERITNSLLGVLPPSLRAIAGGLILLALGIAALIQLPDAITFSGANLYQKVITPPALVLFLTLLLIVVSVMAIAIFTVLSLTKWSSWVCASLAGVIMIAAVLPGAITHIYPSWSSIEDFARALFGG